jgi:hypothetical protein
MAIQSTEHFSNEFPDFYRRTVFACSDNRWYIRKRSGEVHRPVELIVAGTVVHSGPPRFDKSPSGDTERAVDVCGVSLKHSAGAFGSRSLDFLLRTPKRKFFCVACWSD